MNIQLKQEQLLELMLDIYQKGQDSTNVSTEQIVKDIIAKIKKLT